MHWLKLISSSLLIIKLALSAAVANPHAEGLPEAFAIAMADPVGVATYQCHAACGYAIIAARECSTNTESTDEGPYTDSCLCASDSTFMSNIASCLDCGWCLWDDYGSFLAEPLEACSLPTDPTGTTCAPSSTASTLASGSSSVAATTASSVETSSTSTSAAVETSAAESTIAATSAVVPTSSAPVSSTIPVSSAAPISSAVSSVVPSSSAAPSLEGEVVNGEPVWYVNVPGAITSWNSVSIGASESQDFDFECAQFTVTVDGVAASADEYTVDCSASAFDLSFSGSIESTSTLRITLAAVRSVFTAISVTNDVTVTVNSGSDLRRVKRAIQTWELSDTIDLSAAASSSSVVAVSSAAVSSEAAAVSPSDVSYTTVITTVNNTTTTATVPCTHNVCQTESIDTNVAYTTTEIVSGTVTLTVTVPCSTTSAATETVSPTTVASTSASAPTIATTVATAAVPTVEAVSSTSASSTIAAVSIFEGAAAGFSQSVIYAALGSVAYIFLAVF